MDNKERLVLNCFVWVFVIQPNFRMCFKENWLTTKAKLLYTFVVSGNKTTWHSINARQRKPAFSWVALWIYSLAMILPCWRTMNTPQRHVLLLISAHWKVSSFKCWSGSTVKAELWLMNYDSSLSNMLKWERNSIRDTKTNSNTLTKYERNVRDLCPPVWPEVH